MKQSILLLTTLSLLTINSFSIDLHKCQGCHGDNFEKPAMNLSRIVKDLKTEEIRTALQEYKHGSHGGSMQEVMQEQISKFTDSEIDEIVKIIQDKNSSTSVYQETIEQISLVEVSTDSCISCHGEYFEKSAMGYSRIVNEMSKEDIIASMNGYKNGTYGREMKALMSAQALQFSEEEIEALAKIVGKN